VGFQDVAVDPERAFAHFLQVHHRPEASADESLDLDRAAIDPAAAVPGLARVGAAGQHAVLGGQPTLARADEEWRDGQLDGASAEDGGAPHADKHTAGRLARVAALEVQGPQLIGTPAVGSHGISPRQGATHAGRRWYPKRKTSGAPASEVLRL